MAPVERAAITHGHADHARAGHKQVWATRQTLDIMAIRYGSDHCDKAHNVPWRENLQINGVTLSFWPAGHVLGSAQILVEYEGTRILASGDYKRSSDPSCDPFELVPANKPIDAFVTEATFALPVFRHPNAADEIAKLLESVRQFPKSTHLVGAYALGKAQRIIGLIRQAGYDETIFIHGALKPLCEYYVSQGVELGRLAPATLEGKNTRTNRELFEGRLVICPPSAFTSAWARRFNKPVFCFASGWMQIRQRAKQRGVELPLILSDHCDWDELLATIRELNPKEVWVTHGRDDALVRWCQINQIPARPLQLVGFEEESE